MDGALRENSHLIRVEFVGDAVCAVLKGELCDKAAFDDDIDLGAARVGVWGVETAGADEAECHADSGANEGREDLTICAYSVATLTGCDGARRWVVEIIDKIGVIGDQVDAIFRSSREFEGLYQVLVIGSIPRSLDVRQGGGVVKWSFQWRWKCESQDAELSADGESGEQHVWKWSERWNDVVDIM